MEIRPLLFIFDRRSPGPVYLLVKGCEQRLLVVRSRKLLDGKFTQKCDRVVLTDPLLALECEWTSPVLFRPAQNFATLQQPALTRDRTATTTIAFLLHDSTPL